MGLTLENLDVATPVYMREEVVRDIESGALYMGTRLNTHGRARYPELILKAVEEYDDAWLANAITTEHLLDEFESRTRNGNTTSVRVPVTAAETLAEGEFNRFYLRGLSRRAIAEQVSGIEIYRAKAVAKPRSESVVLIGKIVDPEKLLDDVRMHIGVDTALGLPNGPNSGLSGRIRH